MAGLFGVPRGWYPGWVNDLGRRNAPKTIWNKHGFLHAALASAVPKYLPRNPCDDTRLPQRHDAEMTFLEPEEFAAVRNSMTSRWQPLTDFLVMSGAWVRTLAKTLPDGKGTVADALGGKRPRPHDLRHTCASWMIAAGVPLPVISQHLGHESITTTVHVYGHLDRTSGERAAAAIATMLARAL